MKARPASPARVLLLSATAGAGHTRAAEALMAAAEAMGHRITAEHHDILEYTSPLYRKIYSEAYFAVVDRSPELWGYFYRKTESGGAGRKRSRLVRAFDHFNYRRYSEALRRLRPDAVLCTHFLPYAAITDRLRAPEWRIPFFSVPTDFDAHALWVDPSVKRYYVANEETSWTLQSHGILEARIRVTGIPVMPAFAHSARRSARTEFGVPPKAFTILLMSGGYGVNFADGLVPGIANFLARYQDREFCLLVVCGKNAALHARLAQVAMPANVRMKLFPFVPFVDRLMDYADVIVTKSGGLTTAEALSKGLPMLVLDPIPGQEERNANFVVEQGAGFRPASLTALQFRLRQLIEDPAQLAAVRSKAKALGKPHAARTILNDLLEGLRHTVR